MGSNETALSKKEFSKFMSPFLTWCEGRFPYTFHVHYASVLHGDLRMGFCGSSTEMIGVTLFIYKLGSVKKRPEGFSGWDKFLKIVKNVNNFKLNFNTGEIRGQRSLQATVKLPEPIAWMRVRKYISPPGYIGARYLKNHWGYMVKVDSGYVEHLTRKLDEFEFYFSGGKTFTGRYILRPFGKNFKFFTASALKPLIEGTSLKALKEGRELGGFLWIKAKNQTPYVLSDRAEVKAFVPPFGYSALPSILKKRIPPSYQYWRARREDTRRKIRDTLILFIKEAGLKQVLREGQWSKFKLP